MRRVGFTLIELLVVIAIVAMLSGLLMPVAALGNRLAHESATRSVMVTVDAALRRFKADIGPYPYQRRYADLAAGEVWTNRLAYQLGTEIPDDDYDRVVADADAAAACYRDAGATPHAYIGDDCQRNGYGVQMGVVMLNRMAAERARLAIYAGNVDIRGGVLPVPYRFPRRVLPTTPLVPVPASAARPGLAADYLDGELDARYVDGDAVLDAWGRPLIYVCQVVEGMTSATALGSGASTVLRAEEYGLQPLGRATLSRHDPRTGEALQAHPEYLPDPDNLRRSDRRFYAAPGLEFEFELWSAGADGRAGWMRDAAANDDNVSLLPYDEGLR